jgi:tetratricopeptide (TPR) repeat protein
VLAALLTFAVFFPALRNGFVNWDDPEMVTENPLLLGPGSPQFGWMFSTFLLGHYQPLSWLSLALDHALWGTDPFGYHLTSLLLHALNVALLVRLLQILLRLGDGRLRAGNSAALLAGLFWGLHPLRVESVAWVTGRRDVLSGAFALLCVLVYVRARSGAAPRSLVPAWLVFLCALLSHGLALTLPFALLALDYSPLARLWAAAPAPGDDPPRETASGRPWLEKAPFFMLAAVFAGIAVIAARQVGAMQALVEHSVLERVGQAACGLWFYLGKTLLPTELSPLYELKPGVAAGAVAAAILGLLAVAAAASHWRRRFPALLAALLTAVTLVAPVLGLLQSGMQRAADRYTYLSGLALAALLAAGLARLPRGGARSGAALVAVAALFLCAGFTRAQIARWRDGVTLWSHAVAVDPESGLAHFKLGQALRDSGRTVEASDEFRIAARWRPGDPIVRGEWGIMLSESGSYDEAIRELSAALDKNPRFDRGYYNRALSYDRRGGNGDAASALQDYNRAIDLEPRNSWAWNNRAILRQRAGDLPGAVADFRRAVQLLPGEWQMMGNLGMALAESGKKTEALAVLDEAVKTAPPDGQARLAEARAAVSARP